MNRWVTLGCVFGFLGVLFGAFGAHALGESLNERSLSIYHTASQYQMYHALALIGLGVWSQQNSTVATNATGWCFAAGIVIFSGSLYALAISGVKILGAITPIGGLCFMLGWISFAWKAFHAGRN